MKLDVDQLAPFEKPRRGAVSAPSAFLFSIKIVLAEGLVSDGSPKHPDTFVILSNEQGDRLAKTRTVHGDSDPRWDETFDMTVTGPTWFMISIKNRKRASKHELLGRSYVRLDPEQYANTDVQDRLLPLDTRGHLLLRISMENERDDMQYNFGKVFRCLKRTESDMIRALVDKVRFSLPLMKSDRSRQSSDGSSYKRRTLTQRSQDADEQA